MAVLWPVALPFGAFFPPQLKTALVQLVEVGFTRCYFVSKVQSCIQLFL